MADSRWYVTIPKNNTLYYAADVDQEENSVLWCKDADSAIAFPNEATRSQFVERYFKNRTDIKLVSQ